VFKNPSPLPKWCGLLGVILAEIYMFFTVAGPRLQSSDMPWSSLLIRLAAMAVLFGPFGLAVGTGVGILLEGIRQRCVSSPDAVHGKASDPTNSIDPLNKSSPSTD
jgi:hypothetical protein